MTVYILIEYPYVFFTLLILHLLITILVLSDVVKQSSLSYYMCNCEPILLTKSGAEQYCLRKANRKKQAAEPLKNLHNLTRKKKNPIQNMTQYHFCTFGRFATYRNMIWNIALVEKDLKKKDIWGYNKGIHLQGTEQSNCNISEDAHL